MALVVERCFVSPGLTRTAYMQRRRQIHTRVSKRQRHLSSVDSFHLTVTLSILDVCVRCLALACAQQTTPETTQKQRVRWVLQRKNASEQRCSAYRRTLIGGGWQEVMRFVR